MQIPYVGDRKSYEQAAELMETFGIDAAYEAASRADRSRDLGNHIHFCRWRQIERLIAVLSIEQSIGTVH